AGSGGLVLTPHLSPGNNNPFAKGLIMGLSDFHDKAYLYRAIIEGKDLELYHAMVRMQKRSGQQIKELYVAGGGSVSDSVVQICCDVFGLPVKRIQTHEASGIGSSIAAFVSMGEFSTFRDAVKSMVHDRDVFTPNMENHKIYMDLYNDVYRHIEKDNTKLFRKLRKFGKEK
ncbi:MAG TPA: carbohydrate kinase, partial [Sphaerochaeta sp.]|nr:carbohydrate kinase [Sphaerochaeta sp.]